MVEIRTPQEAFEIPILGALIELGGQGTKKEALNILKENMKLSEADFERRESGESIWENNAAWARNRLVNKKEIDKSVRGMWIITDKGRKRYEEESPSYNQEDFILRKRIKRKRSTGGSKRERVINIPHPDETTKEFLQKWATEQGLDIFDLGFEGTKKKYEEFYNKIREKPDDHYLRIIKRLLKEIKDFLDGKTSFHSSDEVICRWIDYCYLFESYFEGKELFKRISQEKISDDLYGRTKKIADACLNHL